ncbi:MAG: hypothetical protein ACM3UU_06555 [Ignavibacteriales bacterium]
MKEKVTQETDTVEYPIRQIVGIGNNFCSGFLAIFEYEDGSAGCCKVWKADEFMGFDVEVKFSDCESKIVFEKTTTTKTRVFLKRETSTVTETLSLVEVVLNRNSAL